MRFFIKYNKIKSKLNNIATKDISEEFLITELNELLISNCMYSLNNLFPFKVNRTDIENNLNNNFCNIKRIISPYIKKTRINHNILYSIPKDKIDILTINLKTYENALIEIFIAEKKITDISLIDIV